MIQEKKGTHYNDYHRRYLFEDKFPFFDMLAVELKKLFAPKTVLDLGCGKGFLVYAFRRLGIEAYGADISEYALSNSLCPSYIYKIDLDEDRLPFEDNRFDLITFLETIECLSNHKHVLSEMKRILKPKDFVYVKTIYKISKKMILE